MMRRAAYLPLLLALLPLAAAAQDAGAPLTDKQRRGRTLYTQSCQLCHEKASLVVPRLGPALDRDVISGQEAQMRSFIATGTDHMPGFKYQYDARQIDAIVDYLKTLPPPPPEPGKQAGGAGRGADQ
jgi:mono/diheme cytochrome c family protein